jgi:glycosyltransferase involved in cell wall biosynthesis
MSRIVVLSSGPLCRNPRVHKEAMALGSAGHDVTVLTVAYSDAEEATDAGLLAGAPFRKQVVDLIPGAGPIRQLRRFSRRAAGLVARSLLPTGIFDAHALGPATALGRRARSLSWDLLIAHTELPMVIANSLLAQGRPVSADFEDWHSRDLLACDRRHRPMRLLQATEAALMRGALSVTTTSNAMADALQHDYGGPRPVVVRNVFPLQPEPVPPPTGTSPSFFWFSQTIGPGRGLEEFVSAWNLVRAPSRLALLGDVSPSYREKITAMVSPRLRTSLGFLPIVPPSELPSVIAGHHLGLALEPLEPQNKDVTISNKVFQYLNAGLGVLATGTAGQREVAALAPRACKIIDLGQAAGLAAEIDSLLSSPDRVRAMGVAARRAAESEFCWERESPRLVSAIDAALAKGESRRRNLGR